MNLTAGIMTGNREKKMGVMVVEREIEPGWFWALLVTPLLVGPQGRPACGRPAGPAGSLGSHEARGAEVTLLVALLVTLLVRLLVR